MGAPEIKNECNRKYAQVIDTLRRKGDLKTIHRLIIEVAEGLVSLGKSAPEERDKCTTKAIFLIKIAKTIGTASSHTDIYEQLTGEHIQSTTGALDSITRELDELQKMKGTDSSGGTKIPDVSETPKNPADGNIRPQYLSDYIGQRKIVAQIKEAIEAAKIKHKPLEHMLLFGSAGLGKTSLSKIIANEMKSRIMIMSGPTIKDSMSLVSVLKEVKLGDIVFIDEIHRINTSAAEAIYTVMEDFELSYVEKDKEGSHNVTINLPRFTLIGATTHSGMLEKPMRDRFALQFKLDLYSIEDLTRIALASVKQLGMSMDEETAEAVAKRSRGVPRICNSFVKRLVDKALVKQVDHIDMTLIDDFFEMSDIDENGLTEVDIQYLRTIKEKFGNGPVGIDNLSACLGEGKDIIESQIEPYLNYMGLVQITSSGRMLTPSGVEYIRKN